MRNHIQNISDWNVYVKEGNKKVLFYVDPETHVSSQYYETIVGGRCEDIGAVIS